MYQAGKQGNAQEYEGNEDQQHTRVSLGLTAGHNTLFKFDSRPEGQGGQHFVNGCFIAKAVGIMNEDLNRLLAFTRQEASVPALTAYGITVQWIFHIYNKGLGARLIEGKIDMIRIEGDRQISSVNANVPALGVKHMEIAPKGDVALVGGDVLPLYDLPPFSVLDAILSIKIHLRDESRLRLQAGEVIEPYQPKSQQNQKQNAHNGNVSVFEYSKFVFEIRHYVLRNHTQRHIRRRVLTY
jgi:hypothetical protein